MRALRTMLARLKRPRPSRRAGELTAAELTAWLVERRPVQILDIRDAAAFRKEHLPGARRLALDRLEEELADLDRGCATVVY